MQDQYYNAISQCDINQFELLSWQLFEHGCLSIEEKKTENDKITFWACYDHEPDIASLQAIHSSEWEVVSMENKDWDQHWKLQQEPIQVSPKLVVVPPWVESPDGFTGVTLKLEAKMAFGTGAHESTQLIAKLMDENLPTGKSTLLDIGTGTGILAMYARKLRSEMFAVGTEIDPLCSPCLAENYPLNNLGKTVSVLGGLEAFANGTQFDTVLSNMIRSEIWPLRPEMERLLAPNGLLFISGQLSNEKEPIQQWFQEAGIDMIADVEDGDWWACCGRKKG